MTKLDERWQRVDEDCYVLIEKYCFPGTSVSVERVGYKQWRVKVFNIERKFMPHDERGQWIIVTGRAWATAYTARQKALRIRFDHDWLAKIGVDVYDPKYQGVKLQP